MDHDVSLEHALGEVVFPAVGARVTLVVRFLVCLEPVLVGEHFGALVARELCVVVLRPSASNLKLDLATNKFVVEKVHETITREKKAQKGKNHYILHIKNTLYPNSDL